MWPLPPVSSCPPSPMILLRFLSPLPARAEMWVQLCSLGLAGGKGDGALVLLKFLRDSFYLAVPFIPVLDGHPVPLPRPGVSKIPQGSS